MYTELPTSTPKTPFAHTLPVLLGLLLLALSGCTSADVTTSTDQTANCEKLAIDIDDLPSNVLAGTNIVDSGSFEDSNASLPGQYQGETGGATIGAMINTESVVRLFEEPGTDPDQRTFQPICVKDPYLFAEGLVVWRVAEGLLWLERDSGVEGLPSDMWLLLKPLQ